jgi:GNAT superfamily N-acetyltransferase
MRLSLSPIARSDEPFLSALYATTRAEEMALVPWNKEQKGAFLQSQFNLQHQFYITNYPHALFRIIVFEGEKIGRLYVCELEDEIRIIDLTILPEYRGRGLGTELITDILRPAAKPVRIHLEAFSRSIGLFTRLGFRLHSDEGVYQLWECKGIEDKSLNAAATIK